MRYLRARLLQRAQDEAAAKEAAARRSQLGSGDRSEKIRTYNFPDGRVTDHRIKHTSHQLADVLAGGEELDGFIDRLNAAERSQQLAEGREGELDVRPAQVVRRAADYLERHDVDAPLSTAEQLLASVLGTDRAGLYARASRWAAPRRRRSARVLCRRCAGTPTQHLTGEAGFRHLSWSRCDPACSFPVPRPRSSSTRRSKSCATSTRRVIVDVGTGTRRRSPWRSSRSAPMPRSGRSTVSSEAVALARENAVRNGLDIEVVRRRHARRFLDPLKRSTRHGRSNPPYIEPEEYGALPREVRADPVRGARWRRRGVRALFAQARALAPPRRVGGRRDRRRNRPSRSATSRPTTGRSKSPCIPDLAGRDRVVVATWP